MNERITVAIDANAEGFNRGINGVIQKLGGPGTLAVAGAAAAAGAAIAAFATKGVQAFSRLETGMAEVFTLMPGISETGMGKMTEDVQAFADEFGVLTGDVVPALYDAISAGVPRENVFEFLRTANQLAVGGVSDMNTAVDGLTSATNAYGTDLLSASEAADIMFTGVRLGKTTIDELARTVSETAPIAASLGVGFDETTAALAAMTSQGEPSQKAATKLRQLMAELSDSGSAVSKEFAKISGESFPDFIAGGGTLQEALEMIADKAESGGGRVGDAFGSIEASMAATMLTSDTGRATMNANLAAVQDSAGATGAAYDTMDATLGRAWDRMKARVQTFVQDAGQALAPLAGEILNGLLDGFDRLEAGITAVMTFLADLFSEKTGDMASDGDTTLGQLSDTFSAFGELVGAIFEAIAHAWETILKPAWEAMQPLVEGILSALRVAFETWLSVLESGMLAFAAFLRGDWEAAWGHMRDAVRAIVDGLRDYLTSLWEGLEGTLVNIAGRLRDGVTAAFTAMSDYFAGEFTTGVRTALTSLFNSFGEIVQGGLDAVVAGFTWLQEQTESIMHALGTGLTTIAGGIGDLVRNAFGNVVEWMTGQVNGLIDAVNGFIDRLNAALEISIPSVSASVPDWVPGIGGRGFTIDFPSINPPDIPAIPQLKEGGLVTSATLALIGEAGPEAVVPLDRLGGMGGNQTIIVELDGRQIMRSVAPRLVDELRLKTGIAGL